MILPINSNNERLITSRAGLLAVAQMMDSLHLDESIDHPSPAPRSNRGYRPSAFIKTLTLMPHEGGFRLDDVRHIQEDGALCTVLGIDPFLQTTPLGDGLRRMGAQAQIQDAWVKVNSPVAGCPAPLQTGHTGYRRDRDCGR